MNVTKNDLKQLKRAYNSAIKAKEEKFNFKGQDVLVSYAKYLIEYLEGRFSDPNNEVNEMNEQTYENMNVPQKEMVDAGLDIINLIKEKEKIYDTKGFGVAGLLFFLPYELEEEGQIVSSPGSVYFSADKKHGMDIMVDALTNFFISDEQKFNLLQAINKNINHKIKKLQDDKSKQKS